MCRRGAALPAVIGGLVLALRMLGGSVAAAQSPEDGEAPEPERPISAQRSAAVGAFAPWSIAARSDTQRATVQVQGGYDGGRGSPTFVAGTEAAVTRRLAVRAGFGYGDDREQASARLGLKLDVLRQESSGVDLAMAGTYGSHGFNLVPAVELAAAIGASVGDTRLMANVAYGQGLELDERHGDVRLGAFRRVARRVHLGLDSRFRMDLERDASEPAGEPEWDVVAGPQGVLSLGRFALIAGGGVSAVKLREGGPAKVGALVTTGVGSAF
jgi:hypothetical protein